jgi:hypothetical protein
MNNGEAAISALRKMSARRDEIARKYGDVIEACKKIQAEVAMAERAFWESPTPDGVRKVAALRPQADVARDIFGTLYRTHGARVDDEFSREYAKDLRAVLVRAAKYLLEKAQKAFNVELSRSRETLTREEFDLEEVEQAPRVRRAKREVERFARLIESIKQSSDALLWQHAAQILRSE